MKGGPVDLTAEEVSLTKRERAGYSIVEEGGYVVALETTLTPELAREGLARELVHRVQNLRRSAGLGHLGPHCPLLAGAGLPFRRGPVGRLPTPAPQG